MLMLHFQGLRKEKRKKDAMQGYVQVYTGDGKGKTTAALGLALRAAGAGLRVFIAQFMKGADNSESEALRRFDDLIDVKRHGSGQFIKEIPSEEDIEAARQGLADARRALASGEYQLVILDEANVAVHFGLFSVKDLLDLIAARPPEVELVITGRRAAWEIIEVADLVTEMVEVKHYFAQGVEARKGIEK